MGKNKKKAKKASSHSNHQQGNGVKASSTKKLTRSLAGKLSGPSATATRPSEAEPVNTYGVVPSEYNIQAQINWLTAPPSSNDKKNANNSNNITPTVSKKPQRGFHKDVCDACGEGECLMYCDKCPVAFHAICDDPPLPPEDFETIGLNWKCKKCRMAVTVKSEEPVLFSPESGPSTSSGNKRGGSSGGGPVSQFFQQSLPHLQAQNPTQFQLPKEMPAYDYPFPGTSRHLVKRCRQRTTVIEVENGIVPRPIALCYHCQKSCRIGALIQCDKCDLFFHLDCVDPPLTTIPTCIWICPLHIEPYLESTQLTSVALSERVKIWENGDKPVNRTAVILDFLRKTSRKNPMFRRKVPIKMIPRHENVPLLVQNYYRYDIESINERFGALQTLAAVCEMEATHVEMENHVEKHKKGWNELYLPNGLVLASQRVKLEVLKKKNDFKMDMLKDMMEVCNSDVILNPLYPVYEGPLAVQAHEMNPPKKVEKEKESWIQREMKTMYKDLSDDEKKVNEIKASLATMRVACRATATAIVAKANRWSKSRVVGTDKLGSSKVASKKQTAKAGVPEKGGRKRAKDPLASEDPISYRKLKRLPKTIPKRVAAYHLKYVRRRKEVIARARKKHTDRHIAPVGHNTKCLLSLLVENIGVTVEMTRQSFWIGSDSNCEWKITDLVKCNRIDKKHARMFYNPLENCWEILNYSPNGLFVNNTYFGFKGSGTITPNVNLERYQEIQERNNRRVDEYIQNNNIDLKGKLLPPCYCSPFPARAMSNAFEGSAKLHAGCRVQIGCAKILIQGFYSSLF